MATSAADRSSGLSRAVAIGVTAGAVAAVIVLVPVLILQALRGVGVILEFQLTASSRMGKAAYASTVGPLLLGIVLHVFVSVVSGVAFSLAAWRIPLLNRWAWISGPVLGIGVFFFMGLVVMPLSAIAPPSPTTAMPFLPGLLIHMFGFGLPIALYVRRRFGMAG